jgi:hypothetical protein
MLTIPICAIFWLAACGGAESRVALRVGGHTITDATVKHWIAVLKGRGGGGLAPAAPAPVPPKYTACIRHEASARLPLPSGQAPSTRPQLRFYCEYELRRFKLKALYLLISYRWVTGEAAELGIALNRPKLKAELAAFRRSLAEGGIPFKRYLRFTRANPADVAVGFELEQLSQAIEVHVAGSASAIATPSGKAALARFGKAFEHKWRARTDCQAGYVVPICRQYVTPKRPPEFVPPTVPLTQMPNGR